MKTNLLNTLALIKAKAKGKKCLIFLVSLFAMLLAPQHAQALDENYKKDGILYHVLDATDPTHITVAVWQLIDKIPTTWTAADYNGGDTSFKLYDSNTKTLTIPNTVKLEEDVTAFVVKIGFANDSESAGNESNLCKNVTKVIVGDNVEELGVYIFKNDSTITSLEIGKKVSKILTSSLLQMPNLEVITVNKDNGNFMSDDYGILYAKSAESEGGKPVELIYVPPKRGAGGSENITVYNGIKKIWANAFYGSAKLKSIKIPYTCTEIENTGYNICPGCKNLTTIIIYKDNNNVNENSKYKVENNVLFEKLDNGKMRLILYPGGLKAEDVPYPTYTIPSGVTEVAPYAFYGVETSKVSYIDLNGVETLSDYAFAFFVGMKSMHIGLSLKNIGDNCFQNTSSLEKITIDPSSTSFSCTDGVLFSNTRKILICYPSAKSGATYDIPKSVETVAKQAFYYAKNLTEVNLGENVKELEWNAFRYCRNLSTINFNNKLETIGDNCFWDCRLLKSVSIPASVISLGNYCFRECTSLTTVVIEENPSIEKLGVNLFAGNKAALTTFTIPTNCTKLKTISNSAFINQTKLNKIYIPASVEYIGAHAFENCTKLGTGTITFNENKDMDAHLTIDNSAFANIEKNSLTLPVQTDSIGIDAFKGWTMTKVTLPAKTTKLSPQAFKQCAKLADIKVDSENPRFASLGGYLCTKDLSTLYIFPIGKASKGFALMPPSLTAIGDYAFYDGGSDLTRVCIPKKVNTLGTRTFGLSKSITEIAFLCDELIDPDKIVSGLNISTFDDNNLTLNPDDKDQRASITIHLRKKVYVDYMANHHNKANDKYYEFYKKFKAIECIPTIEHEDDANTTLNDEKYGDEYFVMGDGTAMLLSTTADVETYVVPEKVTVGGAQHTVGIGDYAFENANSNIDEVVVTGDGYVGAMAFMTTEATRTPENKMKPGSITSNIKQVVFIADSPLDIATNHFNLSTDFNEFTTADGSAQKIYVKKNSLDDYKDAGGWSAFKDQIDYKIPYTQSGTFGTFAREFDVDFSEINGVNADNPVTDDPVVIAFTGDGKYNIQGDSYYVHMTSINLGDQTGKDGTYVPAGSGVLMKKYKDANLYYQIADPGISPAFVDGNFMKGVTVRKKTIGTADGVSRFYISGGKLHEMTQPKQFSNHKSYMEILNNDIPAGAKVMLSFIETEDETGTTGIDNLMVDENADDADKVYYNLNGQRVYTPSKGIYILNGNKVIVK